MNLLINKPRSDINFYENGTIEIVRRISDILELHDGDCVNIAEVNGEHILFKSSYGIRIRKSNQTHKNHGFMRGYNKTVCSMILKGAKRARYRIGGIETIDNKKCVYIITQINYAINR